jgi:acetyl esterase/lipase
VTERYSNKKVVLMGDSAGGGAALILAQRLAARKREGNVSLRQPDSIILQSPWLDVGVSAPQSAELEKLDPLLRVEGLRKAGAMLANGIQLSDPRVSPIYGSLEDLPPVSTWIGSYDCLLPDSQRLRDRYKKEKINTRFRYREKTALLHCYFLLNLPGSKETVDEVVQAIIEDAGLERPTPTPIKPAGIICGI